MRRPGDTHHLEEQAGNAKQNDGDGDLEHHQCVLEREPAAVRRSSLAIVTQRGHEIDLRRLERWREAEGHAGGN